MLTQIEISGFKAIKASGPIRLGPLNLLIGRNGSGKSSLIEALQWLQESVIGGLREATVRRFFSFDALANRRSVPKEIAIRLKHGEGRREVNYELNVKRDAPGNPVVRFERCREGWASRSRMTIFSRTVTYKSTVRSIEGGNPVRDSDALALAFVTKTKAIGAERLLEFLRNAVFLRLSPTLMARPGSLLPTVRGPLVDEEGRGLAALLERLSAEERAWVSAQVASVIDGVEGLEVVRTGGSEGYFQTQERMRSRGGTKVFPIPSWLLSEGTRRITAIFALLAVKPRPSFIAIEEIENGLDPWTLRFVLDALREASADGVQILLTTHSPFLLDHVSPEEVFHVRRTKGDTTYEPIISFSDVVENQGVVAPGAMYIAGYMRDAEKG